MTFWVTESNFFAETLLCEFVWYKSRFTRCKDVFSGLVSSLGFSDFVESPHCEIGFPKALFGVVSSFSAALFVPSGFID